MKIINERDRVRGVLHAWRQQYPNAQGHKADIEARLEALDHETASAADVDAIIGNDSWTRIPTCDECGAEVPEVVQIGVDPDYERHPSYMCHACITKAAGLFAPPK